MLVVFVAAGFAVAQDVARLREVRREPDSSAAMLRPIRPGLPARGAGPRYPRRWTGEEDLASSWVALGGGLRLCALLWAKLFGRRL